MSDEKNHLMYELRLFYVCNRITCALSGFEISMKFLSDPKEKTEFYWAIVREYLGNP